MKISGEWEASLPDRHDPEKAARDQVDERGYITDYENSYAMNHRSVEATAEEVGHLMDLFAKADQGLIVWNEERQELEDISPSEDGR